MKPRAHSALPRNVHYAFLPPSDPPRACQAILIDMQRRSGMTQKEISEALGINHHSMGSWMRGKKLPRFDNFVAAAEAMGFAVVIKPKRPPA